MNTKQIILVFIMFFISMLVLTIPLWADWAMPYLNKYMQSAITMVKDLVEILDRTSRMMGL